MTTEPHREAFSDAFRSNIWGGDQSRSGPGSSLQQTDRIRAEIPRLLKELSIRTMLDIPCGDFFWMNEIRAELESILDSYTGADIVPELIDQNRVRYQSPKLRFELLDLTASRLPRADLVMVRDCFIHLGFARIASALCNVRASGAQYLLASTYTKPRPNYDVRGVSVGGRAINLCAWPFCLAEPLSLINEECSEQGGAYADKSLGLWQAQELDLTRIRLRIAIDRALGLLKQSSRRIRGAVGRRLQAGH